MKHIKKCLLSTAVLASALGFGQAASAAGEIRQVNQAVWSKSGSTYNPAMDETNNIAENQAHLIFLRPLDEDSADSSANIAIDERFQTSLHPGHFSQVMYCSGIHKINIAITNLKNNDLSRGFSSRVDLAPAEISYFYVEVDGLGLPKLSHVEPDLAKNLLMSSTEQTHQISRVVADCPEIIPAEPEPELVKVELDKPINLAVLFRFDSAEIEPVFNQPIQAVAEFMDKYPDTTTVIEGHTDSIGTDSYNLKLSQARAHAVKSEIVNKYGLNPSRLSTVGYGESRPVDTNSTEEGRYNNRRVVATVSAK